jgi:diaminopimelate epimerase
MSLKFTKMHGLGNDFLVIDAISQKVNLSIPQIQKLASRQCGVGFDQLLLIKLPTDDKADFLYEIYNADGSQAEQCGNGVRCVARYVIERGLSAKTDLIMQAKAGLMPVSVLNFESITVDMGQPLFEPGHIPFLRAHRAPSYPLHLFEAEQALMVASMGNPHAIVCVEDIDNCPIDTLGPRIAAHADFPEGVNVEFMQIVQRDKVKLRVFERGSGETLACGTGACAAVAVGVLNAMLDPIVIVSLQGGDLKIEWQGEGSAMKMTGPATTVFDGVVNLG